jgi:hypothetical protein
MVEEIDAVQRLIRVRRLVPRQLKERRVHVGHVGEGREPFAARQLAHHVAAREDRRHLDAALVVLRLLAPQRVVGGAVGADAAVVAHDHEHRLGPGLGVAKREAKRL